MAAASIDCNLDHYHYLDHNQCDPEQGTPGSRRQAKPPFRHGPNKFPRKAEPLSAADSGTCGGAPKFFYTKKALVSCNQRREPVRSRGTTPCADSPEGSRPLCLLTVIRPDSPTSLTKAYKLGEPSPGAASFVTDVPACTTPGSLRLSVPNYCPAHRRLLYSK